jgi:putative DNA primase/helicase
VDARSGNLCAHPQPRVGYGSSGVPTGSAGGPTGLICLADYHAQPQNWLWDDRIPLGCITLIEGDPQAGKSTLIWDMVARVTTGRAMPANGVASNASAGTGNAILYAAEDAPGTIQRNLVAAGADLARVFVQTGLGIQLPRDSDRIATDVASVSPVLVVFDPIASYYRGANSDGAVRQALQPLVDLAAHTGAAIVIVRHLTKAKQRDALCQGAGSIALVALPRAALFVGRDPENPDQRVLVPFKSSLGPLATGLAYRLNQTNDAVVVQWLGERDISAEEVFRSDTTQAGTSQLAAVHFLMARLANGPVPVSQLEQEARVAGISLNTLRRARP